MNQPTRIATVAAVQTAKLLAIAVGLLALAEAINWGAIAWDSRKG
jgi:hypothetical protein